VERYVLIYCDKCCSFFVCESKSKTVSCRRCGKRAKMKNAKKTGFSDDLSELQSKILLLTAKKECDDDFLSSLEKQSEVK